MARVSYDRIDPSDEMIIKLVMQASAIRDMCTATGKASTHTIFYRLKRLERMGYIQGSPKRARDRRVTRRGLDYLSAHGYISREDSEAYWRLYGNG
jgi:SOS-response transcriptional repressor LexA